jgi:DNA-binding PadR family transcriptional regulator
MFHQREYSGQPAGGPWFRSSIFQRLREHGRGFDEGEWNRPPFGPRGRPWGGQGRRERMFDRGDLRFVTLDLLQERPRHGYDIIREVEDRFHGMYSPSPGTVYPTLQLLEDQGLVRSSQQDGKKVYTITDEGRAFLSERRETLEAIRGRMHEGRGDQSHAELRGLMSDLRDLGQTLVTRTNRRALEDPERIRRLREVVRRTRTEVEAILAGDSSGAATEV